MPLKTSDAIEEPQINLTPMIDVMFLLIVFFVVGMRFAERERQYDIQLPSVADTEPLSSLPDEIVVNVRRDGAMIVNGEVRSLQQLTAQLKAARDRYADQAVVIRGEGDGPYQHVVDVLAVCNSVQIRNIAVAYQQRKPVP